jgi:hypothetical protein
MTHQYDEKHLSKMIGLVGGLIAFFNCYDLITITKCHKQEYT